MLLSQVNDNPVPLDYPYFYIKYHKGQALLYFYKREIITCNEYMPLYTAYSHIKKQEQQNRHFSSTNPNNQIVNYGGKQVSNNPITTFQHTTPEQI